MATKYAKQFKDEFLELDKKYAAVGKVIQSMVSGKSSIPLILEGPAGVGKTTMVQRCLDSLGHTRYQVIAGKVTPMALFINLYELRNKGDILVLDDTDTALDNIDALNILKAATDTKPVREVSWISTRNTIGLPDKFTTEGCVIILSNASFTHVGKAKKAEHLKAIESRSFRQTISDDNIQNKFVQICYVVEKFNMLGKFNNKQIEGILNYLDERKDSIKQFDLRSCVKVAELLTHHPTDWRDLADVML